MWPTLGLLLVGLVLAPPPPNLDGVLRGLNLQQYSQLMVEQEIDLPILAQLSEEQLSRIGVKTMGQRMRLLSAARNAILGDALESETVNGEEEHLENIEVEEESEGSADGEEEEHGGGEEEDDGDELVEEHGGDLEGESDDEAGERVRERFELDLKVTSTGKRTHAFTVGENRYYSKGIKKSGASYFYCNYLSGKERCTSSFRVRYHDVRDPMGEEPEVETMPGPHVLTDGTTHLPEKIKRVRERMNVKICQEIEKDPLRPIREIHESCLNDALASVEDPEDRQEFLQTVPSFRQCQRSEYRWRNKIIPPNPATARDISTTGIFTLDPETGINTVVFDDQGQEDGDRILALSHPEVCFEMLESETKCVECGEVFKMWSELKYHIKCKHKHLQL